MRLSIFASAIRAHLWGDLLKSLRGGKYEYEVVFAGHIDQSLVADMFKDYPEFRYITTGEIKPAQCYEIARRACTGLLVCWVADDCIFSEGFVDKVCDFYDSLSTIIPPIISCKTNENGNNETMKNHRFFERNQNTPMMAPVGVMSREYLDFLGGIDSRYICGQYENDIVMRALSYAGDCIYLYEEVCVTIDHASKHKSNDDFKGGYNEDRETLEGSWVVGGYQEHPMPFLVHPVKHSQPPFWYRPITNYEVTLNRNDKFFPYPENISLTKSEEPRGQWS
jgi:hypothetical protein